MTLSISIKGKPFDEFEAITVNAGTAIGARSFSFQVKPSLLSDYPIAVGDEVEMFADGNKIVTGFIDKASIRYSTDQDTVIFRGRSKTQDLIDSTIQKKTFNVTTLTEAIDTVLSDIGANINIVNEVSDIEPFKKSDLIKSQDGDNAFQFLESLARKRQVLLTDNGNGDLVISRNTGVKSLGFSLNNIRLDNTQNNIKECNFILDISNRYNKYIVKAQQSTIGINLLGSGTGAKDISSQTGQTSDNNIRAGRQLVIEAEKTMDNETSQKRAEWQSNFSRARSMTSTVTIAGHSTESGDEFKVNTIVNYTDDIIGMSDNFLIDTIEWTYNDKSGSLTKFGLLVPDAYQVKPEAPKEAQSGVAAAIKKAQEIVDGVSGG